MSVRRRTFMFVAMGLTVWALVTTLAAVYYYGLYVETRATFEELKSLAINTNLLLDYGNGTLNWHNQTVIAGSTVFEALLTATKKVEYKTGAYGVFVSSINGISNVAETPTSGRAWLWYWWNATSSKWTDLIRASDAYILKPDDCVAWRYESYSY